MMKTRGRPSSRERILEAASELVFELGAGNMSLEAVAERAGISKGGLLYNFPTKVALLRGLVARHVERREAETRDAEKRFAGQPNALIRAVLESYCSGCGRETARPSGVLAAIAEDPQLIDPVRAHVRRLCQDLREAPGSPERAFVAFLVLEGLRSHDLFELDALTAEERERLLAFLADFLAQAPAESDASV